jgi:hypothetical protein
MARWPCRSHGGDPEPLPRASGARYGPPGSRAAASAISRWRWTFASIDSRQSSGACSTMRSSTRLASARWAGTQVAHRNNAESIRTPIALSRPRSRERGGGRGIRTPGALAGTPVFKTGAFDRSAIPPRAGEGSIRVGHGRGHGSRRRAQMQGRKGCTRGGQSVTATARPTPPHRGIRDPGPLADPPAVPRSRYGGPAGTSCANTAPSMPS